MKKRYLLCSFCTAILLYHGCKSPDVDEQISIAIKKQDADSLAEIMEHAENAASEREACLALARLRDRRATQCLLSRLNYDSASIAEEAATLLGEIDFGQGPADPEVVFQLILHLDAKKEIESDYYTITLSKPIAVRPKNFHECYTLWMLNDIPLTSMAALDSLHLFVTFRAGSFRVPGSSIETYHSLFADHVNKPDSGYHERYHEATYSDRIQEIAARSLCKITGQDLGKSKSQWLQRWNEERTGDIPLQMTNKGNVELVKPLKESGAQDSGFHTVQILSSQRNYVKFETNAGDIVIELNAQRAPITVKNFLEYVQTGFYDGTIFHRVIESFMIQGGGYTTEMIQKQTRYSIILETDSGLKNLRGTIAMARGKDISSVTSQFFINLVNNPQLDYIPNVRPGYTVFGKVIEGMDVVDAIAKVDVITRLGHHDVPDKPIVVESARVVSK